MEGLVSSSDVLVGKLCIFVLLSFDVNDTIVLVFLILEGRIDICARK